MQTYPMWSFYPWLRITATATLSSVLFHVITSSSDSRGVAGEGTMATLEKWFGSATDLNSFLLAPL